MAISQKNSTFAADFREELRTMQTNDTYVIDLNALQFGDYQYQYILDDAFFAAIDEKEILGGNLQSEVSLVVREQGCNLQLSAKGEVRVTCDRCLDEMTEAVDVDESLLVKVATPREEDADDDTLYVADGKIDLAWLLYEMIEINLPIVHSHQTGECNPQMEELLQTHLCTTTEEPEEYDE